MMMDDAAISMLVKRLSRPDGLGGAVIERAAIMAEGPDSAAYFPSYERRVALRKQDLADIKKLEGLHGRNVRRPGLA